VCSAYVVDETDPADKPGAVGAAEERSVDHYRMISVRKDNMVMRDKNVGMQMPMMAEMGVATMMEAVTRDHTSAVTPSPYHYSAGMREAAGMDGLRMARTYDKATAARQNLSRKPKNQGKRDDNCAHYFHFYPTALLLIVKLDRDGKHGDFSVALDAKNAIPFTCAN
jgi:hypothetical protein